MNALFNYIALFFCIVLQVLVFNRLNLAGGVVLIYLYAFVKMPVEVSRPLQIFTGFLTGLFVDIFCNTPGVHAFAGTTTMWLRIPLMYNFVMAEDMKSGEAGIRRFSLPVFVKFLVSMVAMHAAILYCVEAFTLFNFYHLLLKIIFSTLLTSIFLLAIEMSLTSER